MAGDVAVLDHGEPTDNRLGVATKGVYRARIGGHRQGAHSSMPELGESRRSSLTRCRGPPCMWPSDALLGVTTIGGAHLGCVGEFILHTRRRADVGQLALSRCTGLAGRGGRSLASARMCWWSACRLHTLPGVDTAVFAYTTDVPFLEAWGTPMLLGPGSITVAHTDAEFVEIAELSKAVDCYESLLGTL